MIRATDIHSLTDFTRNAKTFIQKVKETKNPMAITINGDAQVIVQDAETYQQMVDELESARVLGAILEGERNIREGRTRDADEVFSEIRARLGLQS